MKFCVITFGCQMNVHDSDWLSRAMTSRGWERTPEEEAQVFVVNTCSVRDKPEQKVYSELGRLAAYCRAKPEAFVAVGGCVAQQVGTRLFERFDFVRLVFGSDGIASAPAMLARIARGEVPRASLLDLVPEYPEREQAWPSDPGAIGCPTPGHAFVNIMQGCDNFCAYCIVPYVRGPQKSRHPDAVLDECRGLLSRGVREITLLGQNVNSFGLDAGGIGVNFAELLRRIAALPGLARLRFTTSHPKDIDPAVIRAFGELPNLCPQLHLPLQSGSDRVLASMGRTYDAARYLSIVDALRRARPDIALTTDLIVGFPGETDADFQDTLAMLRRVRFENAYSFKYSDRPGVAAAELNPKVEESVAAERLSHLQIVQNKITRQCLETCVGRRTEVLCEGPSKRQDEDLVSWRGRDPAGRVVNVRALQAAWDLAGKMLPVTIVEAKNHSLLGEKAGAAW